MITVTPKAAERLKRMLKASSMPAETAGIRLAVKSGGCSGFTYIPLTVARKPDPHDEIFESNDIRIFVDPKSLVVVKGTEIDHSDNLLEGFVFNNPNAQASCGCGVSFNTKSP